MRTPTEITKIQEEEPESQNVPAIHTEQGEIEVNYRKLLKLKMGSLQFDRKICENEKKIQELVPGAGVPVVSLENLLKNSIIYNFYLQLPI